MTINVTTPEPVVTDPVRHYESIVPLIAEALPGYHGLDWDHRFELTVVGMDGGNGLNMVATRIRATPPDTRVAFTLRIEAPVTLCAADEVDGYPHEAPCAAAGVLLLDTRTGTCLICKSCANNHADRHPAGGGDQS